MRTDKQIAASRANGARSRGPKTPEGKARAARNSTQHGLLASTVLLEGESRERFDELLQLFNDALKPQNAMQHLLIGKMVAAHWRQMRVWNLEKGGEKPRGDYEMQFDRQFFRSFDRYFKLNTISGQTNPPNPTPAASPAQTEPGFEPEKTQPEPEKTQIEPGNSEQISKNTHPETVK